MNEDYEPDWDVENDGRREDEAQELHARALQAKPIFEIFTEADDARLAVERIAVDYPGYTRSFFMQAENLDSQAWAMASQLGLKPTDIARFAAHLVQIGQLDDRWKWWMPCASNA